MVLSRLTAMVGVLVLLLPAKARAATHQTIDLATAKAGHTTTISVDKGELTVEIIHMIPSPETTYSVEWELGYQAEPPLSWPTVPRTATGPCARLDAAVEGLREAKEESQVPARMATVNKALAEGTCSDSAKVENAKNSVDKTRRRLDPVNLPFGAQVTYTITRRDSGAATTSWVVVYQAPTLGEWFVTYGLTFIPNEDELFTTKAIEAEEGTFRITRKEDNQDFDFVPAIFYSYMPTKWKNRYWSHSLGAGLGFDLSDPVVYLGYSGSFRHNVSLLVGLTMHEQRRLAGQYSLDDPIVGEPLSEDQLTEETYRPNWFFGIAFRFGSPPETHQKPQPASGPQKDGE